IYHQIRNSQNSTFCSGLRGLESTAQSRQPHQDIVGEQLTDKYAVITMESGKTRRLGRIFRDDGKTVIVPMDHGVSVGPIEGLGDMRKTVNHVAKGGADAVLVHARPARTVDTTQLGLIVHLSGATRLTKEPNWKVQLCSVKQAVRLGADAVSVHINVG